MKTRLLICCLLLSFSSTLLSQKNFNTQLSTRFGFTIGTPQNSEFLSSSALSNSYGIDLTFQFNQSGALRPSFGIGYENIGLRTGVEHQAIRNPNTPREQVFPVDLEVGSTSSYLSIPLQLAYHFPVWEEGGNLFVALRSDFLFSLGNSGGEVFFPENGPLTSDFNLQRVTRAETRSFAQLLGFSFGVNVPLNSGQRLSLQPYARISVGNLLEDPQNPPFAERVNYLRETSLQEIGLGLSLGF